MGFERPALGNRAYSLRPRYTDIRNLPGLLDKLLLRHAMAEYAN